MLLLAGDIGGTNTRLCLVNIEETGKLDNTIKEQTYPSSSADFTSIVKDFLTDRFQPQKACLALAGPVLQNRCKLTNLPWPELQGELLQQELQIPQVILINDFVAIGYNIVLDQAKELMCLQVGEPNQKAPIAIIGAGTGLGKAFAIPEGDSYQVYPSEGGHSNFAPDSAIKDDLLKALRGKQEIVDSEAVVSGLGIVTIFKFLLLQDLYHNLGGDFLDQTDPAKAIAIESAKPDGNLLCQETMNIFVEAYGAAAGDMAVNFLPYGGLFIAGGIAAQNISLMQSGRFLQAFQKKVRVKPELLAKIPIYLVMNTLSGLKGAVQYAVHKM